MIVGIPKEIEADENRVAIRPAGVEVMRQHGHSMLVGKDAGSASGFEDVSYENAGAQIATDAARIFDRAEMIWRVKEPQPTEYPHLKPGQIYFAYLHLAASEESTRALIKSGAVNIAYETIQKTDGSWPR